MSGSNSTARVECMLPLNRHQIHTAAARAQALLPRQNIIERRASLLTHIRFINCGPMTIGQMLRVTSLSSYQDTRRMSSLLNHVMGHCVRDIRHLSLLILFSVFRFLGEDGALPLLTCEFTGLLRDP